MKIKVTCACGSSFQAPENLAGQVIKCPSCKKALQIPAAAAPPPQQAPEPQADLNDLSALDQVSLDSSTLHGSTAGRSAIRQAPKRQKKSASGDSTVDDQAISQEMDDRMTRLYEVYAGQKMDIKGPNKGNWVKLIIGLGIAAAAIGIGLFVAFKMLQSEYSNDGASNTLASTQQETETGNNASAGGNRTQEADAAVTWQAPAAGQASGVVLSNVEVAVASSDPSRYDFDITLAPASKQSDRRLSMATAAALYRADSPEGPFKQIDRARVDGFDQSTGTLSFKLFDATLDTTADNAAYYRLSGFDSDGNRLFDTPAASFPILTEPRLAMGRVTWNLHASGRPAPPIRVQARLKASGWEDVYLWRVAAEGPVDEAVPQLSAGLPFVIESAVYTPTGITLDGQGVGRWDMRWVTQELHSNKTSDAPVVGAAPYVDANGINFRLIPDESRFTSVTRRATWDPSGQARTITFATPGSSAQTITAPAPPALTGITATAYNGKIHLGWDSAALVAGLDRFADPVQIIVRRIEPTGSVNTLATLSTDSTGYTDTDVANGQPYAYEVVLTRSGAGGADPALIADAWIEGIGVTPVQIACPSAHLTARVTPGPGLDRLYASLGLPELSYDGTGLPAAKLQQQITEALTSAQGVAVVDRAALRCFVSVDTGDVLAASHNSLTGNPAQVLFRLVDATGPTGDSLSLWATDLSDGRSRRIASAPADQALEQTDLFVTALRACLDTRLPDGVATSEPATESPKTIVIGPILPIDEPTMFYRTRELADQLATQSDQAHAGLTIVTRSFWLDDTRQKPGAFSAAELAGTVLIVGRAWSADAALPGVHLHAVDAVTGRLIDRFTSERMTPDAHRQFVQWCGTLKTLSADAPAGDSPLIALESKLGPIHPVWRQALSNPDRHSGGSVAMFTGSDANDPNAHMLAFGVPMPMALRGATEIQTRDPGHPLYAIQPYLAPQHPLYFDQWTKVYADYIEADCASFLAAFEQVSRIQQAAPGPFKPHLLVRGQRKFTGTGTIPANAGGLRMTPAGLNIRTYFPMGAAGQPMIDYHGELAELYQSRPWTMSHAWKLISSAVADAFLKAELYGTEDGRPGRMVLPTTPVSLSQYVTADLLTNIQNRDGYNYKQRALQIASSALEELVNLDPGKRLTPEQLRWATDSLLVLVYEQDPGAIQNLRDEAFRERYFSVDQDIQTDVLRMLVDRVGPEAWDWLDEFDSIDWQAFAWRSTQELDNVTQAYASAIPGDTMTTLRAWIDKPDTTGDGPDTITATGPSSGPQPN